MQVNCFQEVCESDKMSESEVFTFGNGLADLFQRFIICITFTDNDEVIGSFFMPGQEIGSYGSVDDEMDEIKMAGKMEMDIDGASRNTYKRCHMEHTHDNRIRLC